MPIPAPDVDAHQAVLHQGAAFLIDQGLACGAGHRAEFGHPICDVIRLLRAKVKQSVVAVARHVEDFSLRKLGVEGFSKDPRRGGGGDDEVFGLARAGEAVGGRR